MGNEIKGHGLATLAELVVALQSQGAAFHARVNGDAWTVTVTGY